MWKLFFFPFSSPCLHFPALNCTCLMSWRLFFQFGYNPPPHPVLLHSIFPSMPALAFSSLFFFFIQCSSFRHSQCSRRGLRKSSILCYEVIHIVGADIHGPIFHAKRVRCERPNIFILAGTTMAWIKNFAAVGVHMMIQPEGLLCWTKHYPNINLTLIYINIYTTNMNEIISHSLFSYFSKY